MPVNRIQVPDFAGSIQDVFNSHRQNKQEDRRQSLVEDQTERSNKQKQYDQGVQHLEKGLKAIQDMRASTPAGDIPDMAETRKTMQHTASILDQLGSQLGIAPQLVGRVNQGMTSPDGTTVAQNKGNLAATQQNAEQRALQQFGTPQVQGANAGAQAAHTASATATGEAALGVPEQLGVNASNQQAANLSANAANGVSQAEGQAEAVKRSALADMLMRGAGIDPNSEEGVGIRREMAGADDKQYNATVLEIAIAQAGPGAREKITKGIKLSPEETEAIASTLRDLRASNPQDIMAMMQALGANAGGQQATQTPGALPQVGGSETSLKIQRRDELLRKRQGLGQ